MNWKLIAAVLIVMMAAVVAVQLREVDDETARLVLPDLAAALPAVNRVAIQDLGGGSDSTTLRREDNRWSVVEKSGYPADFGALVEFLNLLAKLEVAEEKTARPENHGRLGVAATGDGAGRLVTLTAGDQLFELIVGNEGSTRGSFVRLPDEDQVYLTDEAVDANSDPLAWIDPIIINVDSGSVQKVSIATHEASFLSAERDKETGQMQLLNAPADIELKYATIVDSLARVLVNLRLQDVASYEDQVFGLPTVTAVTLEDGKQIEVRSVARDDGYWVHLDTEELAAWQYRVSEYNYNELNKTLADLVKAEDDQSNP